MGRQSTERARVYSAAVINAEGGGSGNGEPFDAGIAVSVAVVRGRYLPDEPEPGDAWEKRLDWWLVGSMRLEADFSFGGGSKRPWIARLSLKFQGVDFFFFFFSTVENPSFGGIAALYDLSVAPAAILDPRAAQSPGPPVIPAHTNETAEKNSTWLKSSGLPCAQCNFQQKTIPFLSICPDKRPFRPSRAVVFGCEFGLARAGPSARRDTHRQAASGRSPTPGTIGQQKTIWCLGRLRFSWHVFGKIGVTCCLIRKI